MKTLQILLAAPAFVALTAIGAVAAEQSRKPDGDKMPPLPPLKTLVLGGVEPSEEELVAMQKGNYVLHARDGQLTKIPVEKSRLPHDPHGHAQVTYTAISPDGVVYVNQCSIMCKSTDGGKTWTSYPREWGEDGKGHFQILNDGTFVSVWAQKNGSAEVMSSSDEGRSWKKISEITPEVPGLELRSRALPLYRLPDDTLLWTAKFADPDEDTWYVDVVMFRSEDGGRTWSRALDFCEHGPEGGITRLPSGRLLAVVRYQRPKWPGDPDNLIELTRGGASGVRISYPYKHLFLLDSDDDGRTWSNFRQLTTAFGQCYGFPVALSDGATVVVRHNGYNPNRSGLAMISYDEGQTWEDEAYFMYAPEVGHKGNAGYSQSVVLADDMILTIAGTTRNRGSHAAAIGRSDLTAIRWMPRSTGDRPIGAELNREEARAARQQALAKQRRIIFNDDTHELDRADANTPEGFLRRRLKPLVGTPVDVISWSVLGGLFDAPVYDSKIQPVYGDAHPEPPQYYPRMTRNVRELIDSGYCPLEIVIEFAHDNDMELFASVRMNDCHDSFLTDGITSWKKEHPEFMVDSTGVPRDRFKHPLGLYWTAQDFAHQEVRDRKFEIIEEICRRYDIDGVDLNFMRHPVFFSHTMRGQPVTDEELEIMTGLVRRIRRLTDARGLERDRPILLAAIVPDNLQLCRNVGLDVETWIKEDLIDIVIPGMGYAPFTLPVEEFVDLAHPYGVNVYPCINRKAPQNVSEELVSDGFRGLAANWYAAGADGIFFWNLGTPFVEKVGDDMVKTRNRYYAALPQLGSPQTLRGTDKLFCLDDWQLNFYEHVSSQPPLPVELEPDETEQVTLVVADDLQAAARDGSLAEAILTLEFAGLTDPEQLSLRLNGRNLVELQTDKDGESLRISSALEARQVQRGENVLEVTLNAAGLGKDEAVRLSQVQLLVRYKP